MSTIEAVPTPVARSVSEAPSDDPIGEKFAALPPRSRVEATARALGARGIHALIVDSREEARAAVERLLPVGAQVFDASSVTLEETGISRWIQSSGRYDALRPTLLRLRQEGNATEQRRLASAPDVVVGSVHAVTEQGQVIIASASGSQLAAYVSGAGTVIWVVGTQKIVTDLEEGMRRIDEYVLPRESDRARRAYGVPGSTVAKVLIVNRELQPDRITVVFVNERLGF